MTCSMDIQLGAYVLHALEPEEADVVRRHLAGCELCREEATSLAFTASLLALLTPEEFERLDEQPSPRTQEVAPRGAHPHRRRRIGLAAAAAVLAAAPGIGAVEVLNGNESSGPAVVQAVDPDTNVRAAVTMSGRSWGTQLRLKLSGAYPTGWCSLVARSGDGRTETAASWVADGQGNADVKGTTDIPVSELSELRVLDDDGELLVRIRLHQGT